MWEFISWVEKDNHVLFLTANDVFNSERGKELRDFYKSPCDYVGHGAIRFFYNFKNGAERECTDFSTPDNFPDEIVDAIKLGEMAGLGVAKQLLTKSAWAVYLKVIQLAVVEYEKVKHSALTEYKKVEHSAFWDIFKIKENRNPKWR